MKIHGVFLSAIMMLLSLVASPAFAQITPPVIPQATQTPQKQAPTPTTPLPQVPGRATPGAVRPTHISIANCDVCGYCNNMTEEQIPGRWASCQQCVYPGFGEIEPRSNMTIQGTDAGIPTPDLFHIYTDLGCISTRPGEFASQIARFFFSIVGGIAFLFFIYGAGIIATSRSDPGRLNEGKRIIYGAIAGLIFALFSVLIIGIIGSGLGLPNVGQ